MDAYTQPDPSRAALLTIDVQRDFSLPDAPATIPGTMDAVPQMADLCDGFRRAERPIVHVVRLYEADGSNVDLCRRRAIEHGSDIVRPGSEGAELVADLAPDLDPAPDERALDADRLLAGAFQTLGPDERVMYKPRWSAFYETPLEGFLRERNLDTVVVCGCNFPNCPRTTLFDASQRGFRIVFVPDATSGTYNRGVEELANVDVATWDTDATLAWLDGAEPVGDGLD